MKMVGVVILLVSQASAATHRWVSSTGDFADPASWNTGVGPDGWLPADRISFDTGNQNATFNLDHPGVRIAEVFVDDSYGGDVGAVGNHLRIDADRALFVGAAGVFYSVPDADRMRLVVADCGYLSIGSGFLTHLFVKGVSVDVQPLARVESIVVQRIGFVTPDVRILGAMEPPRNITVFDGIVENYRVVGWSNSIDLRAGEFHQHGQLLDGATLRQTGGLFYYTASSGNPVRVKFELLGGTTDLGDSYHELHGTTSYATLGTLFNNHWSQWADHRLLELGGPFPATGPWDWNDDDGDGLENARDKCPNSPAGSADLDGDCRVSLIDFAIMQNQWSH